MWEYGRVAENRCLSIRPPVLFWSSVRVLVDVGRRRNFEVAVAVFVRHGCGGARVGSILSDRDAGVF